ncbi:MAG: hypothetical protein WEB87_06720 [Bacteriovoracaceae bacterium]
MDKKTKKTQSFSITLEGSELSAQQKRLLKTVSNLLAHVMTTDDEGEYFDSSSELMKLVAGAIKQANFTSIWREDENIPYSTQALEFCLDNLNDEIYSDKIVRYDN